MRIGEARESAHFLFQHVSGTHACYSGSLLPTMGHVQLGAYYEQEYSHVLLLVAAPTQATIDLCNII